MKWHLSNAARPRRRLGLARASVLICLALLAVTAASLAWLLRPAQDIVPIERPTSDETLGMVLIDIADDEAAAYYHVEEMGVYVLAVQESSPAEEAGVRSGDRIVSLNGVEVRQSSELFALQSTLSGPNLMELVLERDPAGGRISVTLEYEAAQAL